MIYFNHIKTIFLFLFLLVVVNLTSCSKPKLSELFLEDSTYSSKAFFVGLNSNAIQASIAESSEDHYMLFAFPDNFLSAQSDTQTTDLNDVSLSVTFSNIAAGSGLSMAFLYDTDFVKANKLVKELAPRSKVSGTLNNAVLSESVTVSMAMDKNVKGFLVYCTGAVSITNAILEKTTYGWQKTPDGNWYGYSSAGGTIPSTSAKNENTYTIFDFTNCPVQNKIYQMTLTKNADVGTVENQTRSIVHFGNDTITIRRVPNQSTVTIYPNLLENPAIEVSVTEQKNDLTSLLLISDANNTYTETPHVLHPVLADPGMIVNWPQNTWRYDGYEVFKWEQFSDILVFDTENYAIQSKMFKRLAFYLEKTGYAGTIWPDSVIASLHGYNAHDYQAKDLARFFAQAEKESFQLNEDEVELKDILFQNGLLQRDKNNNVIAGVGAIASISRETPSYLRVKLLCHELLHGLYFTHEDYRNAVAKIYAKTDKESLRFLLAYWEANPSLGYDTTNQFLVQNEFMAYMVQQSVASIPSYYAKNIATWKSTNRDLPELAEYIRDTNAIGFVIAATSIQKYLFSTWGFAAGRVSLVYLN